MKYEELDGPAKQRALDTVREYQEIELLIDYALECACDVEQLLGIELVQWGLKNQTLVFSFDAYRLRECGFEFYWVNVDRDTVTRRFCRLLDEFPTWTDIHEAALELAELSIKYDPADWYIKCRVAAPDDRSFFFKGLTIRPNDDLMDRMWNDNAISAGGTVDDGYEFEDMVRYSLWRETQLKRGIPLHGASDEIENELEKGLTTLQRAFGKLMQSEYEHNTSDEAIIESIKANDWEFTEEGRWA